MPAALVPPIPARALGACLLAVLLAGCAAPGPPGGPAVPPAQPAAASAPAPVAAEPALPPPAAPSPSAQAPLPAEEAPAAAPEGSVLLGRGLASWYGPGLHGRRTANGERFDRYEFTAAHRTLPFGARVCVRSMVNGKVVVVRVNDRGPFAPGRVIDLSQAAAQELEMTGLGIKPVEIWHLGPEDDDCPERLPDLDDGPDGGARAEAPAPMLVARKSRAAKPKGGAQRR